MRFRAIYWIFAANTFLFASCFNGYNENEELYCGLIDSDRVSTTNAPSIFKVKCATCHHLTKDGTGPKLKGALKRLPSEIWLRQFITNEDSLAQIGDSLTLEVQKMKPTQGNHNFQSLTNKELGILVEYIK